jgi:hypothetical protein
MGLVALFVLAGAAGGCAGAGPRSAELRPLTEDWPDGTPRLRASELVQPGEPPCLHGVYRTWHADGSPAYAALLVCGKKVGIARRWHANGQLYREEHYRGGRKDGLTRTWDADGNLRKEERFASGRPVGTWRAWNAEGQLKGQTDFEDGQVAPQESTGRW